MAEKEKQLYTFAIAGFFVTDEDPQKIINDNPDLEEIHKLEELMEKVFFNGKAQVIIAPIPVPPEQVDDILEVLGKTLFGGEEKGQ